LIQLFLVPPHEKVQIPFLHPIIPETIHFRKLITRVDVDDGKGNVAEESFPTEPKHRGGILPHGPEHGNIFELIVSLSNDVNTFVFQPCQMIHEGVSYSE
jgi:hypothetical protein